MEFLLIALMLVTPLFALFAIGRGTQPSTEQAGLGELTPRAIWSTVVRGNEMVAPTTPYGEFARRG